MTAIGISGMALSVPRFSVDLESWCQWSGGSYDKVSAVIGRSYRLPGSFQDAYTLAATAVMRLIQQYNLDPGRVGFLGFGTESSTDNSAGAVIIRGMVDRALKHLGLPVLSRNCEVPEFKHACLGGIYALKNAIRYLAFDGRDKMAIVVTSDVAKYEPGSTGEPTQGSGAVAMLLESDPKMLSLDLDNAGNASCYRGPDFRKPFGRYLSQAVTTGYKHIADFPLFNGKYSTSCYLESVLTAMKDMFKRRKIKTWISYLRDIRLLFMHRPYSRLPRSAWGLVYIAALGRCGTDESLAELEGYCQKAEVDIGELAAELSNATDLFGSISEDGYIDPYPQANAVLRAFRTTSKYQEMIESPMALGSETMQNLGNLYTAALPAWLAAGLSQASGEKKELSGEEMLLVGYGSGDAAEVIPAKVASGWRLAAQKINLSAALAGKVNLNQEQYTELHQMGRSGGLECSVSGEFVVERTGQNTVGPIFDSGIDYYRYVD